MVSVDLDLKALEANNLVESDVVTAISNGSLTYPSGTAKIGGKEVPIDLNVNPPRIDLLNDLPIKIVGGTVIHISDVAQVRDGYMPQENVVRQDGVRSTLLTIFKNGAASTLSVAAGVKAAMANILKTVTSDVQVKQFADQSVFVKAAVSGVVREGVIAAALTALMILLFLGSWRSTLIIAVSIPLSVLSSLAILSLLGQTINIMTLGGLALAVGILVDDATVTIENVERHLASGEKLEDGILKGAGEIALPAMVSTFCICIVFVPMFSLVRGGALSFRAVGRGGDVRRHLFLCAFAHAGANDDYVVRAASAQTNRRNARPRFGSGRWSLCSSILKRRSIALGELMRTC